MKSGKVFLVGAGPGDAGLITVKGAECVKRADVILFDRLVEPSIWAGRKGEAELIYVGKMPGRRAMEQDEINRLLVRKARAGKVVVRLKGGDPFIFGRGGEEALALAKAGVEWEVVPGVTAAVGSAAYAGIPLTHRGVAAAVTMATGHEDPGKGEGMVDWGRIAAAGGTVAAYMGVENLANIARGLMEGGMRSDMPAAVVSWGTTVWQRVVEGTVGTIAGLAAKAGIGPPAVTIFGEVVGLRKKMKWFERRPLLGRKVVVTRAWAQAAEMGRALTELGAEVISFPTIRIEAIKDWRRVDGEIKNLGKYDWVVFTSGNGVQGLMGRMSALGLDARALGGVRICAIGPATAERLGEYYLRVDCMPKEYVSRAIVGALKKCGGIRGKNFLLARGDIATSELPEALRALGGRVKEAVVYRTVEDVVEGMAELVYEEEFAKGGVAYVTFTSASTARSFAARYSARQLREIGKRARVVSIGPVTSKALRQAGLGPRVEAREHTVAGVIRAILQDAKPRKRKK